MAIDEGRNQPVSGRGDAWPHCYAGPILYRYCNVAAGLTKLMFSLQSCLLSPIYSGNGSMLNAIVIRLRVILACMAIAVFAATSAPVQAQPKAALAQPDAAQNQPGAQNAPKRARAVGTVKSIDGDVVTLTADNSSESKVTIQSATKLLRMEPGQTDLKTATPIRFSDIQVGDRLLVGGTASEDGKSIMATTAVVMKKSDVAEKQQHDREEWQKHGVGGVVKSVDAAGGNITLSTGTLGAPSTLLVQVSKDTIIRRYAPDSIKFDDAKPGTLDQIKPGDQLRARGTKSEDGKQLTAVEIVSGTFRSIAATVISTDAGNNTITVTDLANKRPVTLKTGPDSQMHELPEMFAQRIAMRLKAGANSGPGAGSQSGASGQTAPGGAAMRSAGATPPPGGATGAGRRPGGSPDFQQMLSRMPEISLSQLSKGSAVMIVATEGTATSPSTVIVLLSGVEPILIAASPAEASTVLSPWSLSSGSIGGTGDTP